MASPLAGFEGYKSKTIIYKDVNHLNLRLDVLYAEKAPDTQPTVLIHYHGGFLVTAFFRTHPAAL